MFSLTHIKFVKLAFEIKHFEITYVFEPLERIYIYRFSVASHSVKFILCIILIFSLPYTFKLVFMLSNITKCTYNIVLFLFISQHNFKKIRNNIDNSRESSKKRLMINGNVIVWEHLYQFYQFDQQNPVPVNRYLTVSHFNLTSGLKMRNHLAEQVMNHEMLHIHTLLIILQVRILQDTVRYYFPQDLQKQST